MFGDYDAPRSVAQRATRTRHVSPLPWIVHQIGAGVCLSMIDTQGPGPLTWDMATPDHALPEGNIVLFDGTCPLCHRAVVWLLQHDPAGRLRFAPLQGETAQVLRRAHPDLPPTLQAVAAVVDGRLWLGAPAVWALLAVLPRPWCWGARLRCLPAPLSAAVYRLVASVRYRLFGRYDTCRIPQAGERARFLP